MRMRFSATGLVLGCLLFLGAGSAFGNVILDVNFSSGPAGVKSDYTPTFENDGPGQVMVLDTPSAWNADYADPTGTGNMLVADGATDYKRVWYKDNIWVTAGQRYDMSFDATSLTGEVGQFADLGLYVRTNPFASIPVATIVLDNKLGTWKTVSGAFTPTANGLVQIFIGNLNTSATGNAFAIDNISVHVPEPSSLALLGVGSLIGLGVYTRRRRTNA